MDSYADARNGMLDRGKRMIKDPTINGQTSDGYHTFDELYEHRNLLFINLCLSNISDCWWNTNGDYAGYFCLYMQTDGGQISYHIPNKHLHLIDGYIRNDRGSWDGHTSDDVLMRLEWLAIEAGEENE